MAKISRFLFSVARSRLGGFIVGWSFANMSSWLPVHRLCETEFVVAFHHPKPTYPTHILIVPKRQIRSMLTLTEADFPIIQDVISTTQRLVKAFEMERSGYRLVVNGGVYQAVKQVHWHLISDEPRPD